ncbi:MAG: PSP1 domain-containing protein [Candidatus Latescibacterota bacterium]
MIPTDNNTEHFQGPADQVVFEVEFKGSRRDYFLCPENITPKSLDYVIVQADRGEHIGRFLRSGLRSKFPQIKELKNILRIASYTDTEILMDNLHKEEEAFDVCLQKIAAHELKMKLVDVEYQFDGNKICFYFTADKRIDFRALVKDLAAEYRTRIELRQIGVRDEARRLGGMGVCGRTLCCKSFLLGFEPITSQMARDQNLSLSPSKISGLCGRLMCCLAYEEDFYKIQAGMLPSVGAIVENEGKRYEVSKVDIFNEFFTLRDVGGTEKTLNIVEFAAYTVIHTPEKTGESRCGRCAGKNGKPCPESTGNETAPEETNRNDIEAIPE